MKVCRLLDKKCSVVNTVYEETGLGAAWKSGVTVLCSSFSFCFNSSNRKHLREHAEILFTGSSPTHFNWCVVKYNKCSLMTGSHVPEPCIFIRALMLVCSGSSLFVGGDAEKDSFLNLNMFSSFTSPERKLSPALVKMTGTTSKVI